jgi:salicylate hydroxylase
VRTFSVNEGTGLIYGGRNGITGRTVKEVPSSAVAPNYRAQRARRTNLQSALIKKVPEGFIKLKKRLVELTDLGVEGARLVFEDGEEIVADLVIGGDGIRSVVRQSVFSDHAIQFTGK